MRVSIEHRDKNAGFFKGATQVEVITTVRFSEEELAIIKRRQLEECTVLNRKPNSREAVKLTEPIDLQLWEMNHRLKISNLMNGQSDSFVVDTPLDAKTYQIKLTEALKQLKSFIAGNASLAEPATFEL